MSLPSFKLWSYSFFTGLFICLCCRTLFLFVFFATEDVISMADSSFTVQDIEGELCRIEQTRDILCHVRWSGLSIFTRLKNIFRQQHKGKRNNPLRKISLNSSAINNVWAQKHSNYFTFSPQGSLISHWSLESYFFFLFNTKKKKNIKKV